MDVDSQGSIEETILVGDDLMTVPPSPLIPPEIAPHVLEGVDLCNWLLRNLYLCVEGFLRRWGLHGSLTVTRIKLESLKQELEKR